MRISTPKSFRLVRGGWISCPAHRAALFLMIGCLWATPRSIQAQELDLLPTEPVVTQHTATIRGETVRYTAEAGTLPIRQEGKVTAGMFYVAYTRDNAPDGAVRPLLLSFNGGPGTASVWMHMGYTGPDRKSVV